MTGGAVQTASSLQVTTSLGADTLLLRRLDGSEYLSAPFFFTLEMDCTDDTADPARLLGQAATVKLIDGANKTRYLNGLVTRLAVEGSVWRAELRPWLWLLTLATDSRIFQNQSVTDIVAAVFKAQGFTDFRLSTTGSYTPLPYCVQYQESAFNFVSRLLEQFGIWYRFDHEDGQHIMVLADDAGALAGCPDASVPFLALPAEKSWVADIRVGSAALVESVATAKFQSTDFNFITPATSLLAKAAATSGMMQIYEYPGLYQAKGDGDAIAGRRIEEFAAPTKMLSGASTVRSFSAGAKFSLTGHPSAALNIAWALAEITHHAERNSYDNSFTAWPAAAPYRPPRRAVKPRIAGSQTAMVVGKAGEEIWTDQYGRIKIQFHWDLVGSNDENSSCWVRVAQSWAGKSWGGFVLPRVGQEVVVSFLDGDPDRPLVTGCVYNGDFPVPYALPDFQTRTTLKSNSSKGGGGSNELCFDDKAGNEEIYVHAQKDLVSVIENSRTVTINQADDTLTIAKGNRTETISEGNDTLTIAKGNRTTAITKGNESITIGGTRAVTVTGKETLTSKDDASWTIAGNFTLKVEGDITIQAGGALNLTAGTSLGAKSGTDLSLQAGTQFTLKGAAGGTVDGGATLTVKGGMVKIN